MKGRGWVTWSHETWIWMSRRGLSLKYIILVAWYLSLYLNRVCLDSQNLRFKISLSSLIYHVTLSREKYLYFMTKYSERAPHKAKYFHIRIL